MSKIFLRLALAGCLTLTTPAFGSTIVVDVMGGGAFTAIQPAVNAAQPGDIIVVMPGFYATFNLTKPLTIVGNGAGVFVINSITPISVSNIAAGERVVIANIQARSVSATGCAGHVMLIDFYSEDAATVTQCADVRFNRSMIVHGLTIVGSRVELTHEVDIGSGWAPLVMSLPVPGRPGIACSGASRVHVAVCQIGGEAGQASQYYAGSDGGPGIQLGIGDLVILSGSSVIGGVEGWGDPHPTQPQCSLDGIPGPGIRFVSPGVVQHSGSTIGGAAGYDPYCNPIVGAMIDGTGTLTPVTPDDPTLEMVGTPSPGGMVQVVVRATPGSIAHLRLGRNAVLMADGLTEIEQLTGAARQANLGIVPSSGQITIGWNLPASWTIGTFVVLQADITLPGGALRRTNSVPIVAR